MAITHIKQPETTRANPKLNNKFEYFEKLIEELEKREIPEKTQAFINHEIEQINSFDGNERALIKLFRKCQMRIFQHLEKELKLVRKGHYRLMWLSLGMSAFGVPLGLAFGLSLDNMGLLGIGIPIGMAIGIAVGSGMDQSAKQKGNQLDIGI